MPNKGNAPARTPTCHPDRKHLAKGLCKPCYDYAHGAKNRDRLNVQSKNWARRNPNRVRAARIKYRYGITPGEVQARLNAQDGLCKVCVSAPATDIDHDHVTGKVRSILCGDCNRALGLFRDDPERLRRAAAYIELWDDRAVQVEANTGLAYVHPHGMVTP